MNKNYLSHLILLLIYNDASLMASVGVPSVMLWLAITPYELKVWFQIIFSYVYLMVF
jgi:hypothetical protein